MSTPETIRNMEFTKSINGYKTSDVELFLEQMAQDIEGLNAQLITKEKQCSEMKIKLADLSSSQDSIQNVLISAQRLADTIISDANIKSKQIVEQANDKSESILRDAKSKLEDILVKTGETSNECERDVAKTLRKAAEKSEGMILAALDSVARQQLLFDKLKIEISDFKKSILEQYKAHVIKIQSLPNEVPFDSNRAAEAVAFEFDKAPDFLSFASTETYQENDIISDNNVSAEEEVTEENKFYSPVNASLNVNDEDSFSSKTQLDNGELVDDEKIIMREIAAVEETVEPIVAETVEPIVAETSKNVKAKQKNIDVIASGLISFGEEDDAEEEEPKRGLFGKRK